MLLDPVRMQTLVLARAATSSTPLTIAALARELERFAPEPGAGWRDAVEATTGELIAEGVLSATRKLLDEQALSKRLGTSVAYTWTRLTDWAMPAMGLGISAGPEYRQKLGDRDSWAAAIAGRALGLWREGAPPTAPALCDQLAWLRLGLGGKAKRLPEEVRAVFLQRELGTTPGPVSRLLRLLAARELGVASTELRALRNALVRRWLERGPLQANEEATARAQGQRAEAAAATATASAAPVEPAAIAEPAIVEPAATVEPAADSAIAAPAHQPLPRPPFSPAVAAAAAAVPAAGRFGDRKVFIFAAWQALVAEPAWRELSLADFKAGLLTALRDGGVVLARADLVGAMNAQLVERSELESSAGATFHFIVAQGA